MNFEPFESVVVKPKGFDRVDAGCVVIVLVSGPVEAVAWTTVTEITVEKGCLRTEVSVAFVAVLAGVELVEEGKSALVETEGGGACGESLCGKAGMLCNGQHFAVKYNEWFTLQMPMPRQF
jgi:hypothetical protein